MLVIDFETLRNTWNREIALLREEMPEWDEDWIRAHARSTVVERFELQILRMLDQVEGQRQELINLHMGF